MLMTLLLHYSTTGVELVLYFATITLIRRDRARDRTVGVREHKRSNLVFLWLSNGLLSMITIYLIVQAFFGEEMWITYENYPGGTAMYFADHASVWYETLGSAAGVVLSLMSDGFLVSAPSYLQ